MKKRLISIGLIATLCAGISGCGNVKTAKEGGDVPTLKWIVPGDAQADIQSVMDAANEIVEKEIGAKLDMQFVDAGSFTEKMKLMMASGDDFDLCFTGYVNPYKTAVDNGGLMDITDMIDKVDGLREAIPDYAWEAASYDGKIYAVPNVQIMATAFSLVVFEDIADKYDFDWSKVQKIDDIEPYLETVKQNEPDIYPYQPSYGTLQWTRNYDSVGIESIFLPRGSKSADDLVFAYDTEEWNHGVRQLWNWYQKGYIRQDALSIGDDTADYKAGKYAVSNQVWKPGADVEISAEVGQKVKLVPIEKPYMDRNKCTATMIGIGQKCKNPEKALEFIKLINTNKELYNIITFGVEGKHYKMENGRAQLISGSGYTNNGAGWKFGNVYNTILLEGQDEDVWEQTEKVNNEADKSTLLGFVFDNSNVKTQISNIKTVLDEYNQRDRGVQNPDEYLDEFKKKLNEAGLQEVYDEVKAQLTEYFKTVN